MARLNYEIPVNLQAPDMSQWAKVQQHASIFRQMEQVYPPNFSVEVRYFLCEWVEEQQWDKIDENDPSFAPVAAQVLTEMIDLLKQKISEMTSPQLFLIKMKLDESVQKMENTVKNNPLELVVTIKNCLAMELQLIEHAEQAQMQAQSQNMYAMKDQFDNGEQILSEIQNVQQRTKETEQVLKTLQHKQESFIINFSDNQRIQGEIQANDALPNTPEKAQTDAYLKQQKNQIDQNLQTLARDLLQSRLELSKKYDQTIVSLQDLQKKILDDQLISWKRRQQLAGNGLVIDASSLETLQEWCESLADLIWQNRHQIKKSTQLQQQLPIKFPDGEEDLLPKLNDTITGLLSSLVTSTFIVEQQPPQILKKDARFGATVRLLVGGKLNVHMNPPQVKATIISELQAKNLLRNDLQAKNETSGDILNNTGNMEYQNGQLSINFRNMQLKKIKRADKKGSEAVTEEKFCILFQSDFSVGGNELGFQVWTLSLPVVVTVHGNQECNATATVLWDNAFAEAGRVPFTVPDQIDWKQLADQLSMKFQSYTGKGLSPTNLEYIASKLFPNQDPTNCKVSWAQFNKDTLPGRTFTFWEWFYSIQKLTKEHLKDLWTEEAIIGFVSKNQAQEWLGARPKGTFLLRFSDSELAGITIAWTGEHNGDIYVWNLAPCKPKELQIRGLADRIKDLPSLVYLYPDKPKDEVFAKFYTSTTETISQDGYVKPTLRTHIGLPGMDDPLEQLRQPFSPDSVYNDAASVQPMDDVNMGGMDMVSDGIDQLDLNNFQQFDYTPEDIESIDEINIAELLQGQSMQS